MFYYFLSTNLLDLLLINLYLIYENRRGLIVIYMNRIYILKKIKNNCLHNLKSDQYSSRPINSLAYFTYNVDNVIMALQVELNIIYNNTEYNYG